jgi:hypothetical protein
MTAELNTATFRRQNDSAETTVTKHLEILTNFGFKPDGLNTLGTMYQNLKAHKDPPAARFITSSTKTPLKQLSLAINQALNKLVPFLDSM